MGRQYLTIAFVLAGSSVIAASFISECIPTFTTTFLSLAVAALTAIIVCGRKMYDTAKLLPKKIWIVIVLQAVFGCFLFRVFLTTGLRYTGATVAGIITGAPPQLPHCLLGLCWAKG